MQLCDDTRTVTTSFLKLEFSPCTLDAILVIILMTEYSRYFHQEMRAPITNFNVSLIFFTNCSAYHFKLSNLF